MRGLSLYIATVGQVTGAEGVTPTQSLQYYSVYDHNSIQSEPPESATSRVEAH
jgi:hypothetical protein